MYASDLFARTLANTWGTATTGGAYTLQGTAADFDTTGTTGTIALTAASPTARPSSPPSRLTTST